MAIPMKLCKQSKNLFIRKGNQAQTPYYVSVQSNMQKGHTYTISTNIPFARPSNLYGYDRVGDEFNSFQVYAGHPVTLTVQGDSEVPMFYPYQTQTSIEGTCVNVHEGLLDGTYWVQIEEGTEATAYEEPGMIYESYDGHICVGKLVPYFPEDDCE